MATTTTPHLNRLAQSKSPYLLQHATNPVDWYEWGEEAFAKAREEDKPIFLSVGYSACHWCHVLAHESFENEEIGRYLSDNFVCVKVDREERPDVDRLYMTFIQATVGRGGWPMSVFLTPSLHPFFGGTYFPPDKFFSLLQRITQLWKEDADDMRESGENVMRQLEEISKGSAAGSSTAFEVKAVSEKVAAHWAKSFDAKYGGFGAAPKFPSPAMTFYPLARHGYYSRESSPATAKKALEMSSFTLRKINDGGIHDHVGGGFSRYSVDNKWLLPHFEKMLYDQGQLLSSSLSTSLLLPPSVARTELESMSADIISYLARDLANPGGGFYSAEDADSLEVEGGILKKEGAFYLWEERELKEILGNDVEVFATHFGVKLSGNVPSQHDIQGELVGKNVLARQQSIEETAKLHNLAPEFAQALIDRSLSALKAYRDAHRPRPHLDDKVLTSWNALLISALSLALTSHPSAQIRQESLKMALGTVSFLRTNLWDSATKTLLRSWRDGPGPRGMSDDYAFLVQGMLDLYEANGREEDLLFAHELQARQDELFLDTENGGYFCSPADDPFILVRLKDSQDGAEPSASGVALGNLHRLGAYFDDPSYAEKAKGVLRASGELLSRAPYALGTTVGGMWLGSGVKQLIVVGNRKEVKTQELLERIYKHWIPNRLLVHVDPKALPRKLAEGNEVVKALIEGGDWTPSVRVCEGGVCGMPITSVEELEKELARV